MCGKAHDTRLTIVNELSISFSVAFEDSESETRMRLVNIEPCVLSLAMNALRQ